MREIATQRNSTALTARNRQATVSNPGANRSVASMTAWGPALLQRKAVCACGGGCPTCSEDVPGENIQTKLRVSAPADPYEQEADEVADQVMRMPNPALQRQVKNSVDESDFSSKEVEQPPIQSFANSAPGIVASEFTNSLGSGVPLDTASRSYFEPRFAHDFSGVRVHTDDQASERARAIQARAYTLGRDIVFAAGEYAPSTFEGKRVLAHELAHVVQQSKHAGPLALRQAGGASGLSPLPRPVLQRTVFTPGVNHNHRPARRWSDVQRHPNSGGLISVACSLFSPSRVVDIAIWRQFGDKPTALRHLRWYLSVGGGRDFPENDNFERFVRSSERFRQAFTIERRGRNSGSMEVPQAFFGPSDEDFRFSFGAIDRMDFEVDEVAGTVHLWFKDRYEYHPVYPFYSHFSDDEVRETNCVHAAMVELKDQGAADFWMVGETTVPSRLFAFEPSDVLHEESAESIRGAASFLDTLRQQLQVDRIRARGAAAAAGGSAEGSRRAHSILNQAAIRATLTRGRRIYDAQQPMLNFGHPLLERFRDVYFNFLGEVRAAFDESLALSRNDQQAETEEQTAYGENLLRWMEASPMREAAMHDRATFTSAFQGQEANLTSVLTNLVPSLNFAQPGMPARAREAINAAVGRNPHLVTDPARTWATGPVPGLADNALAQIDQAEQTMDRGRVTLRAAIARIDVWLQAPAQPIDVADRVDELFHTRDAGYGRLLRDRLQLMLDNIEGRGQLVAHTLRPGDTSNCANTSTLGEAPRAYELIFCRFSPNVDSNAATLLHLLAGAVIPGRGTRSSAASGSPIDRASSGERLMLRMSTEEALNNAESYAQLIEVLAGLPATAVPTDTVTGCADSGPWLDAMALAQSAHRRAWSYLHSALDGLNRGAAVEQWLRALIDTNLGSPSDTDLRTMLTDFENLQADATVWHMGHAFSCPPARACPANALAFDNRRVYRTGAVASRARAGSSAPRICPPFFSLAGADDRARAAHVVVSLSFGNSFLIHPDRAWGYAALALALYRRDIGGAPAASLAEHQAADQPASP